MASHAWLPATDAALLGHVGGQVTAEALGPYVAAACGYVEARRSDVTAATAPEDVDDDTKLGAIILTARLYARRGTALGLANYGDFGPAGILRADPDLARLLRIGAHTLPAVG